MSRAPRCECCDLPIYSCGKDAADRIRRAERAERAALLDRPGWFAAQYPGRCSACGEWFSAGTPITSALGGWRAECCADGTP